MGKLIVRVRSISICTLLAVFSSGVLFGPSVVEGAHAQSASIHSCSSTCLLKASGVGNVNSPHITMRTLNFRSGPGYVLHWSYRCPRPGQLTVLIYAFDDYQFGRNSQGGDWRTVGEDIIAQTGFIGSHLTAHGVAPDALRMDGTHRYLIGVTTTFGTCTWHIRIVRP